jgi:hypothetical protein
MGELAVEDSSASLDAMPNIVTLAAILGSNTGIELGIGIEPVDPAAVQNGVLNVCVDTGHTFVYIRQNGSVVSLLSYGPGQPIGISNLHQFLSGNLPGNAHWPLSGSANTWEFPITSTQMGDEEKAIKDFKDHVPNYTTGMQCTAGALSVAAKSGVSLPDGVGPVIAKDYEITLWKGNVPNPYKLNEQMTSAHGKATATDTSKFPTP